MHPDLRWPSETAWPSRGGRTAGAEMHRASVFVLSALCSEISAPSVFVSPSGMPALNPCSARNSSFRPSGWQPGGPGALRLQSFTFRHLCWFPTLSLPLGGRWETQTVLFHVSVSCSFWLEVFKILPLTLKLRNSSTGLGIQPHPAIRCLSFYTLKPFFGMLSCVSLNLLCLLPSDSSGWLLWLLAFYSPCGLCLCHFVLCAEMSNL